MKLRHRDLEGLRGYVPADHVMKSKIHNNKRGLTMMENITLNGEPISDYVRREEAEELREVLTPTKLKRQSRSSATMRNHSGAKSSSGYVFYKAYQEEQKIMIKGNIFSWEAKGPFVPSGYSVYGAVELTEDESQVKCAECGDWVSSIGNHVGKHKMTGRNYKIKHGINIASPIMAPATSRTRRKARPNDREQLAKARSCHTKPESQIISDLVASSVRTIRERQQVSNYIRAEDLNLKGKCEAQRIFTPTGPC